MSEIMLLLAREWKIGSIIVCFLLVISYLSYSILLLRNCRKYNYDVGVSAFIPFINIFIWFNCKKYKYAVIKESYILDEEFEL